MERAHAARAASNWLGFDTLTRMQEPTEPTLVWSSWPARERPGAAIGLLATTIALAGLAGVIGGELWWGLLAGFLVLSWLHGFLLPTRFEVSTRGVVARGPLFTRRVLWRDATRLGIEATGGWIGRAVGPRWRRRGIDLLWAAERAVPDRLLALAREAAPGLEVRDHRETVPGLAAVATNRGGDASPAHSTIADSAGTATPP